MFWSIFRPIFRFLRAGGDSQGEGRGLTLECVKWRGNESMGMVVGGDAGADAAEEPALDEAKVSIDGGFGDLAEVGGLFGGAAEEVAELDELDFIGIELGEFVEGAVEVEQLGAVDVDPGEIVGEGDALASATAHLGLFLASVIDEDHTHDACGEGVEVAAVFPGGLLLIEEAEVKLVDEDGSLEDVWIALAADIGGGHFTEVGVNERH
jgi:hypothetical protein